MGVISQFQTKTPKTKIAISLKLYIVSSRNGDQLETDSFTHERS